MCKKGETDLYNVSMFSFSGAILLVSVRARHTVRDSSMLKKRGKGLVFTTPVGLY